MNRIIARTGVPALLFFILLGMCFGENGIFRIQFDNYAAADIVCSVSLVFIMFYGGFGTNMKAAKPVIGQAALLSTLGVALTAGMVGFFAHFVLQLSWLESFLTGSVIASTDAASVFGILRSQKLGLKYHTASLLELESGSNDPMSYMLTAVCIALMSGFSVSVPVMLAYQIGIGILCGVLCGKLSVWFLNRFSFGLDAGKTMFVIALAVLAYALPQVLGGNGYLSVYLCGIWMGNAAISEKKSLVQFFDALTGIAQIVIFFLLGLLVTPVELPKVFLPALGIMLFMTFAARPAVAALLLLPFGASKEQTAVVSWAGLRGVASIVFAIMAVLAGIPLHYNLFNLVFCIVLLSIALQGTLLPFVSRQFGMIDKEQDVLRTFNDYQEESEICFAKTHIGKTHPFAGKMVMELSLPPEFLLAMILRNEERIVPNGRTQLLPGDLLIFAAPEFTDGENLKLEEKAVGNGSRWAGHSLREIKPPQGTLVITVQRGKQTMIAAGDTRIEEGDILILARYAEKTEG